MAKHQMTHTREWGSKDRKADEADRGLNAADRRAAIAEQVAELDGCATDCETCEEARRARRGGRFVWVECMHGNTVRS